MFQRCGERAVKVAVIGVGAIGKNHARIYDDLPDVELVGVALPIEKHRVDPARVAVGGVGIVADRGGNLVTVADRDDAFHREFFGHHDPELLLETGRGPRIEIEQPYSILVNRPTSS